MKRTLRLATALMPKSATSNFPRIQPVSNMNGGVGSAYGAGKAGSGVDPISIITKPHVILRLLCWVR